MLIFGGLTVFWNVELLEYLPRFCQFRIFINLKPNYCNMVNGLLVVYPSGLQLEETAPVDIIFENVWLQ